MRVGYARTSTLDQQAGFEAQLRELKAAGCEKVFQEQVSSVGKREQLEAALEFVRDGDILSVTRLDRLARPSTSLKSSSASSAREPNLQILGLGIDMSTATGQLIFTIIGAIACFEREMMLERQREGIAKAKAENRGLPCLPICSWCARASAGLAHPRHNSGSEMGTPEGRCH
jgi:DNA invertase Pin-like site-specific DNA recombinase